jgi:hypothetical protein
MALEVPCHLYSQLAAAVVCGDEDAVTRVLTQHALPTPSFPLRVAAELYPSIHDALMEAFPVHGDEHDAVCRYVFVTDPLRNPRGLDAYHATWRQDREYVYDYYAYGTFEQWLFQHQAMLLVNAEPSILSSPWIKWGTARRFPTRPLVTLPLKRIVAATMLARMWLHRVSHVPVKMPASSVCALCKSHYKCACV